LLPVQHHKIVLDRPILQLIANYVAKKKCWLVCLNHRETIMKQAKFKVDTALLLASPHKAERRSNPFYLSVASAATAALFFLVTCFADAVHAQPPADTATQPQPETRLKAIVDSYVDRGLFQGVVQVNRNGQSLLKQAAGFANNQWQIPNALDVRYLLASISKQFTAAGVLRLQEQGRLDIDQPIKLYLADLPKAWGSVTARQLLNNTSGIASYTNHPDLPAIKRQKMSPREILSMVKDRPLSFSPGTQMEYSNTGFTLLAMIIEQVSQQTYEAFLTAQFFKPLGMNNTGVANNPIPIAKLATGYARAGILSASADPIDMSLPFGGGNLFSTANDLMIWQQALYAGSVFKPATLEAMLKPNLNNYAMGIFVNQVGGQTIYSHSGGIDGFSTFLQFDPSTNTSIAVLANAQDSNAQRLAKQLNDSIAGRPVVLPDERLKVSAVVANLERFEGVYQVVGKSPELSFTVDDGALWMQIVGDSWSKLIAQSDTVFYSPDKDAEVTFAMTADSKVVAVNVPDFPHLEPWKKIKNTVNLIGDPPIYLRGSMNNWTIQNRLTAKSKTLHETSLSLLAGSYEFKVASEDWRTVDLGQERQDAPILNTGSLPVVGTRGNITLRVDRDSNCLFSLDSSKLVRTQVRVRCEAR
jgi:CubicO group peptidase (beta-lactamase class C family)